jgi:hypothetical protein
MLYRTINNKKYIRSDNRKNNTISYMKKINAYIILILFLINHIVSLINHCSIVSCLEELNINVLPLSISL